MVRGKKALILRLICSFALILALWPAKASAVECAAASKVCHMACCRGMHAMAPGMCSGHAGTTTRSIMPPGCDCKLSAPEATLPDRSRQTGETEKDPEPVAILSQRPVLRMAAEITRLPGIEGVDSGPPPKRSRAPDSGRAPPVVYV